MNHENHKKKRSTFNNLMFVFSYIWKWDKSVFLSVGFHSIFLAISPFIWIFAPKLLIDELLGLKRVEVMLGILASALVISAITNYSIAYSIGAFRMKMSNIRFNFIDIINDKAMEMDYRHTEDPKILNDIHLAWRTVRNPWEGVGGVLQKVFTILGSLIGFFGYVTIIMLLNPIILVFLIINVCITYYLTLRAKGYERSKKDELSDYERKSRYVNMTMSDFQFGKDIRIYSLKSLLSRKKRTFDGKRVDIAKDVQGRYFKTSLVDSALLLLREGVVYTYLVYSVIFKGLTLGNFTMYAASIGSFAGWMDTLMKDIAFIKINCMYINDLRNFLDIEDEEGSKNITAIPKEKPYEIEFKNVSFKYPNTERYIFRNLNLKIKAGHKLAIVGINGAGKTTLVKLITRLYSPTEGEILLNGINVKDFDQKEYFKIFSVVFQEIKMFAFNVAENIAYSEDINMDRLEDSIRKAGIKEKIDSLKNGIKTNVLKVLDEYGVEFSGGENQKLSLARALYKDGEIVILDEPTAALDPIAEHDIYKGFDDMIENRTSVYISHRLSSTRFCDVIAFFEDGEIKEYGTHTELMDLKEKYAEMFNIQAQYYKEDQLISKGA
ncbi:ABC transporter ATP-binding protein [Alkaliphilus serpentinus]|uniref:ABC transporter ATP-binding protein n=1 Tax=Alkaliphilus serpentinus TaxID=1482731 RepID=A0A833ME49_9FIRM|nr:ABC transporter ATP-binding protein [Alkaliphilus serpentinus]KAB3530272.1 ABC transporter ATP-binding protein [Alkaliphilus serpentinus]